MANLIKIICPRCDGSGNFSFNLMHGTVCFKCNGKRFLMVDAAKHAKAEERRKVKAEADKIEMVERIEAGQKRYNMWHEKYKNDSRLGSAILARMAEYEAVRFDVYQTLAAADNGEPVHPSTLEKFAYNTEILLAVPYKDKEAARVAGAKWKPAAKAWVWPESAEPLPDILEKYRV